MPKTIDYYFSPISPFAYLAGNELETKFSGEIRYHPIDILQVFAATGGVPLAKRSPQRLAYRSAELRRISAHKQMPIVLQPGPLPLDSRVAARVLLAARESGANIGDLSRAILTALWAEELDISDPEVLHTILENHGLPTKLIHEAEQLNELLDRETRSAISAGVFGSPFYLVNGEPFWGQDHLDEAISFANL